MNRPGFSILRVVLLGLAMSLPLSAVAQGTLSLFPKTDVGPIDPNGFLFNPTWQNEGPRYANIQRRCHLRATTGYLEQRTLFVTGPCLSADERGLVTLNEAGSTLSFGAVCSTNSRSGSIKGHVNWFPVTATGQLRWGSFSAGMGDHDLTMVLIPPVANALTSGNGSPDDTVFKTRAGYHVEFFADETLQRLREAKGFWESVRAGLSDDASMRRLLDGRLAVVTGLYGLDGVHGLHSELHPVYAMAVLLEERDSTTDSGDKRIENWAVMVRNLGNEGDCSAGQIPMPPTPDSTPGDTHSLVIDLGWLNNAALGGVTLLNAWTTPDGIRPTFDTRGSHLYLRFQYSPAEPGGDDYLFLGTIAVEWSLRGSGDWLARFDSWRATSPPAIVLGGISDSASSRNLHLRAVEDNADSVVRKAYGIKPLKTLEVMDSGAIKQSTSWQPAEVLRQPVPAVLWVVPHKVGEACEKTGIRLDVCSDGRRWMTTPFSRSNVGNAASIGFYLRPHGSPRLEGWNDFTRILGIFGWRWEVRRDRYVTDETIPRTVKGYTILLLQPSWEPLSTHLLGIELTPYVLPAGLGLSVLNNAKQWRATFEYGTGLQVGPGHGLPELFFELNHKSIAGGFESHLSYSIGLILSGPFFTGYGHK